MTNVTDKIIEILENDLEVSGTYEIEGTRQAARDIIDLFKQEEYEEEFDSHENAKDKGFWDDYELILELIQKDPRYSFLHSLYISNKLFLISSEIYEAFEGIRNQKSQMFMTLSDKIPDFLNIEEELADTLIRIDDLATKLKLRVKLAKQAKKAYNRSRPRKHGKQF